MDVAPTPRTLRNGTLSLPSEYDLGAGILLLHDDGAVGDDRRVNAGLHLRMGTAADADLVAGLYLRARHHAVPEIPPLVHPDDEVRRWMRGVLAGQEVWLACADDGALLGLMVLDGDWVGQLHVDSAWTGRGLGTRFLEQAKRRRPGGLQLWTFVSNTKAQRFYERNGFAIEERTDGRGNEEHEPDLRYVWRPCAEGGAS